VDHVKGSRILRERLGQAHRRPVEPKLDEQVSQEATARILRWTNADSPRESSPPTVEPVQRGRLRKRRR